MERQTLHCSYSVLRLLVYKQYKHSHGHSEAIKAKVGEGKDIMSICRESKPSQDHRFI